MVSLSIKVTESFFDRKRLDRSIGRAKKRNLSRRAAFVRTRARSMLRRRKRVSQPGKPPSIHTKGKRNLKLILFAYESLTETAIVGPVKFSAKGHDVPAILEHGGQTTIETGRPGRRERKRVMIRPRPTMGPALEAEASAAADDWKDTIGP